MLNRWLFGEASGIEHSILKGFCQKHRMNEGKLRTEVDGERGKGRLKKMRGCRAERLELSLCGS